jgi:hypothetical protein
MFREEREYDCVKIKVVSSNSNELRLRWIPTQEDKTPLNDDSNTAGMFHKKQKET